MTAVDHAELKRLADALRVPWSDRGWTLASLLKEARQAADGLDALLSEIEGLKAERDAYRDAAHLEAVDCDAAQAALGNIEAVAEAWSDRPEVQAMVEATTSVFAKWASPELLSRFRQNMMGVIQQAYMEGALRTQATDSWRPDREAVARIVDGLAFGVTNDPATDGRREAQRDTALAKADAILALLPQTAESGK